MKVQFKYAEDVDGTTISFIPQAYDASTLVDLHLDTKPKVLSRDCYAVIAALCLAGQASGQLDVVGKPCSGHVVEEISRFFAPVKLRYTNVSQQPVPIAERFMTAFLDFGPKVEDQLSEPQSFSLTFSPKGVGAFYSEHKILIGSNLTPYLGLSEEEDFDSLLRYIASALVLADDFYIGKIVVSQFWSNAKLDAKFNRTVSLLNTVGIALINDSA